MPAAHGSDGGGGGDDYGTIANVSDNMCRFRRRLLLLSRHGVASRRRRRWRWRRWRCITYWCDGQRNTFYAQ